VRFQCSFPQVHESRLPEDSKDYVDEMDQNRVRLISPSKARFLKLL